MSKRNKNTAHRVERHSHKITPEILYYCTLTESIYNNANYIIRQKFFAHRPHDHFTPPTITEIYNQIRYLPASIKLAHSRICKSTIKQCLDDWDTYKESKQIFKVNPELYNFREPKPPKKKRKLASVIFDKHTIRTGDFKHGIISVVRDLFAVKSTRKYTSVKITPKRFGCVIEVQYEIELEPQVEENSTEHWLAIDLGINILCALTTDQNLRPVLINGRIVKSINQYYNKYPSKFNLGKRYYRLENYFHHTSRFIIDYCIQHRITVIVIGKNPGWKFKVPFDKKRKQHFAYIPFNLLIQKIKYKAEAAGIRVVIQEESYTSRASAIDGDFIPTWDGYHHKEYKFSGTKIKGTGYYRSKDGTIIHKDVNGSFNHGRKYLYRKSTSVDRSLDETWSVFEIDLESAARPVLVNPLRTTGNLGVAGSTGGKPVEQQDLWSVLDN